MMVREEGLASTRFGSLRSSNLPRGDFGYDTSDYCDIDSGYGTLADYDRLVEECHRRGIRIVLDLVLNHSSDLHPWFEESKQDRTNPKQDWYVWVDPKDDGSVPNNWLSLFGGKAWTFNEARGQYYMHSFLKEQPDLNCTTLRSVRNWRKWFGSG